MPITNAIQTLRSVRDFDVVTEAMKIINANGYYIASLLREQLALGKDSLGKPVTIFGRDFYRYRTILKKEKFGIGLGKHTEWVTNYMSGRFYNSLKVLAENNTFSITSDVPYFPEILQRSGTVIMELDEKHLTQFSNEILIPQLELAFNRRFNGL